jgi:hypothetical protein
MKKALAILLAVCSSVQAQTFITVTADTNRVIRTNFSLVRSQVLDLSGATFAISNITGLQAALDGKLAANGDAIALTNFPALLLRTNGSALDLTNFPLNLLRTNGSAAALTNFPSELLRTNGNAAALTNFPSSLLRTNGDGSGLTNLPNADLGSATGILPISNGGTGQTNAAAAIEALLPAYTNNADKILALDSNATSLIWVTNGGGGGGGIVDLADTTNGVTNTLGVANGGTGGTNRRSALQQLNILTANAGVRLDDGTNTALIGDTSRHITIGSQISVTNTNTTFRAVAIGIGNDVAYGGVAIGSAADAEQGISIGPFAYSTGYGIAMGQNAGVYGGIYDVASNNFGGIAIGYGAVSYTNSGAAIGRSAASYGGAAIGQAAFTRFGAAVGWDSFSSNGIAGGYGAWTRNGVSLGVDSRTTNGVQLLTGTNTVDNSVQLLSAGSVDTNEWARIAALSTYPTTNISVVGTNNTNTLVFSNGILVQVQ